MPIGYYSSKENRRSAFSTRLIEHLFAYPLFFATSYLVKFFDGSPLVYDEPPPSINL